MAATSKDISFGLGNALKEMEEAQRARVFESYRKAVIKIAKTLEAFNLKEYKDFCDDKALSKEAIVTPLHYAVETKNIELLKQLLAAFTVYRLTDYVHVQDSRGQTALTYIDYSDLPTAQDQTRLLLKAGAGAKDKTAEEAKQLIQGPNIFGSNSSPSGTAVSLPHSRDDEFTPSP